MAGGELSCGDFRSAEVKEVNHKINESIREAENRLKLLEISRSFMDNPVWGPTVPTVRLPPPPPPPFQHDHRAT